MEKAMHGAHGISYEVYSMNHDARMKVEKKREQDYIQSQRMVADLDRKVHS
jgi:aminoglycoside/choline kinase family phosphotransferase